MADEIQKSDAQELQQSTPDQITISNLIQLAKPLIETYTKSQFEQRKQELEHNLKSLQIQSKQNIVLIIGIFIVLFVVLIISGYLYIQNRDATATSLIQIVIALAGAGFGGYGWAQGKQSKNKEEK